jgi:hypothetical protein
VIRITGRTNARIKVSRASLLHLLVAGSAAVKPGEDFEEPLMMIVGPFIYGLLANIY